MQASKAPLKFLWPVVVVIVTAALVTLLILTKPKPESKPPQEHVWQVKAMEVQLGSHVPGLSLLGQVQSPSLVTLTAAVEADVAEVHIADGQFVKKGQELITLDNREAKQRLVQRQGELKEAKAQLDADKARNENDKAALKHEQTLLELSTKTAQRLEKLARQDLGARSQLDEALQAQARQELAVQIRRYQIEEHSARLNQINARLDQAKARVELAKLDLERTRILAPFDGRITKRHVASGQRVRMGDALVALFDVDQVEVVAQIPWSRYSLVSQLLEKQGTLAAKTENSESTVTLKLVRMAGQVEESKGGVDAIFSLEDGHVESMQLGRVVKVELNLPEEDGSLIIPYEALYGLDKVYRIEEERLVATEINVLGEASSTDGGRYVVVRSQALEDGDQVLITKFSNAMHGLSVHTTP